MKQNQINKLPKIIGHRGIKNLFPENTIESIKGSFEIGLNCIEVDVKISKDEVPFLLHDDTLDRTTNGKGLANLFYYSEIKNLDAGSFFYESKTDIYPPTLKEILSICSDLGKSINIELKPNKNLEKRNVDAILDVVKNFDKVPIYFSSFDLFSCIQLVKANPNFTCGLLVDNFENQNLEEIIKISHKYNFYGCGLNLKVINNELVNKLIKNNLIVMVYSEKNITFSDAVRMWNIGVQSIFSDDPRDLLRYF